MQGLRILVPKQIADKLEEQGHNYLYQDDNEYVFEATQEVIDIVVDLMWMMEDDTYEQ